MVEVGGALVNVPDLDGATPLHIAAAVGSVNIARYLIYHGACLYAEDDMGDIPLHYAIRESSTAVTALLLDMHEQYQKAVQLTSHMPSNEDGETPLHLAASIGSATMVDLLLRYNGVCRSCA